MTIKVVMKEIGKGFYLVMDSNDEHFSWILHLQSRIPQFFILKNI